MGPTWVMSAPDGPHILPMELAISKKTDPGNHTAVSTSLDTLCIVYVSVFAFMLQWLKTLDTGNSFFVQHLFQADNRAKSTLLTPYKRNAPLISGLTSARVNDAKTDSM